VTGVSFASQALPQHQPPGSGAPQGGQGPQPLLMPHPAPRPSGPRPLQAGQRTPLQRGPALAPTMAAAETMRAGQQQRPPPPQGPGMLPVADAAQARGATLPAAQLQALQQQRQQQQRQHQQRARLAQTLPHAAAGSAASAMPGVVPLAAGRPLHPALQQPGPRPTLQRPFAAGPAMQQPGARPTLQRPPAGGHTPRQQIGAHPTLQRPSAPQHSARATARPQLTPHTAAALQPQIPLQAGEQAAPDGVAATVAAGGQLPGPQQEVQVRQQEAVPASAGGAATQRVVPQDWGDVTGAV
jgi:hypothetical protein